MKTRKKFEVLCKTIRIEFIYPKLVNLVTIVVLFFFLYSTLRKECYALELLHAFLKYIFSFNSSWRLITVRNGSVSQKFSFQVPTIVLFPVLLVCTKFRHLKYGSEPFWAGPGWRPKRTLLFSQTLINQTNIWIF